MIKIIPTSGLANRMRAIDSALALARTTKRVVEVIWVKDKLMNCKFGDLFMPIENVIITERSCMPIRYKEGKITNLFIPSLLRKVSKEHHIPKSKASFMTDHKTDFQPYIKGKRTSIVSNSQFHLNPTPYAQFKPVDKIKDLIREETISFDKHTIGIHIRRSDNQISIDHSPLSLFEEKIEKELYKNSEVRFYLASDCQETKQYILKKYPNKIITNTSNVSRNSKEDIERAVTELYALSKTQKVYGSYWSSFSETACRLSGIESITVKKQSKKKAISQ